MFDRFAGIYHAFGCLGRHVEEAIAGGREAEAETRLLGAKYDSLPSLLEKTAAEERGDPVTRYVTFLCGKQLSDTVASRHPAFRHDRRAAFDRLDQSLARIEGLRASLGLEASEAERFLAWYEEHFLMNIRASGRAS